VLERGTGQAWESYESHRSEMMTIEELEEEICCMSGFRDAHKIKSFEDEIAELRRKNDKTK